MPAEGIFSVCVVHSQTYDTLTTPSSKSIPRAYIQHHSPDTQLSYRLNSWHIVSGLQMEGILLWILWQLTPELTFQPSPTPVEILTNP